MKRGKQGFEPKKKRKKVEALHIDSHFFGLGAFFKPFPILLEGLVAGLDGLLKGFKLAPVQRQLPPELCL